jgi:DNA-binding XRE family transcriptional regulator
MGRNVGEAYVVRGFVFMSDRRHFTDAALYGDWVGETRSRWTLREELRMGAFPEGLILDGPEGVMVVVGRTGQRDQKLRAIGKVLGQVSKEAKSEKKVRATWGKIETDKGRWLYQRRVARGWTQRELAKRAGVSNECISMIERGINTPRMKTKEKLMKALAAEVPK